VSLSPTHRETALDDGASRGELACTSHSLRLVSIQSVIQVKDAAQTCCFWLPSLTLALAALIEKFKCERSQRMHGFQVRIYLQCSLLSFSCYSSSRVRRAAGHWGGMGLLSRCSRFLAGRLKRKPLVPLPLELANFN